MFLVFLGGLWKNYWSDQLQTRHLSRGQRSIDDIIITFDFGEIKYALLIYKKKVFLHVNLMKTAGKEMVVLKFEKKTVFPVSKQVEIGTNRIL